MAGAGGGAEQSVPIPYPRRRGAWGHWSCLQQGTLPPSLIHTTNSHQTFSVPDPALYTLFGEPGRLLFSPHHRLRLGEQEEHVVPVGPLPRLPGRPR